MIDHLGFAGKSRVSLKPKAAVTRLAVIQAPSETVGGAAKTVSGAAKTVGGAAETVGWAAKAVGGAAETVGWAAEAVGGAGSTCFLILIPG